MYLWCVQGVCAFEGVYMHMQHCYSVCTYACVYIRMCASGFVHMSCMYVCNIRFVYALACMRVSCMCTCNIRCVCASQCVHVCVCVHCVFHQGVFYQVKIDACVQHMCMNGVCDICLGYVCEVYLRCLQCLGCIHMTKLGWMHVCSFSVCVQVM